MSKKLITESLLTNIADAIRAKNGTTGKMTPAEMSTAIANIKSGGTDITITTADSLFAYDILGNAYNDGLTAEKALALCPKPNTARYLCCNESKRYSKEITYQAGKYVDGADFSECKSLAYAFANTSFLVQTNTGTTVIKLSPYACTDFSHMFENTYTCGLPIDLSGVTLTEDADFSYFINWAADNARTTTIKLPKETGQNRMLITNIANGARIKKLDGSGFSIGSKVRIELKVSESEKSLYMKNGVIDFRNSHLELYNNNNTTTRSTVYMPKTLHVYDIDPNYLEGGVTLTDGTNLCIHNAEAVPQTYAVLSLGFTNIYVPDALLDSYKTATNWSIYASRMKALSTFTEE